MQYLKHPNSKVENSKRMISIKSFLCISLLCVVFSLLPLLLVSWKPFLMQFYTYTNTVDKTYMFLLCNGLVALIALNSALFNDFSSSPQSIEKSSPVEFKVSHIAVAAPNVVETEPPHPQEEEEEEEQEQEQEQEEEQEQEQEQEKSLMKAEQENNNVLSDTQEDHEEERNAIVSVIDEDEQEHGADETEELNKKCEEFIRRMKAAIRADHRSFDLHNQKSLVALVY